MALTPFERSLRVYMLILPSSGMCSYPLCLFIENSILSVPTRSRPDLSCLAQSRRKSCARSCPGVRTSSSEMADYQQSSSCDWLRSSPSEQHREAMRTAKPRERAHVSSAWAPPRRRRVSSLLARLSSSCRSLLARLSSS